MLRLGALLRLPQKQYTLLLTTHVNVEGLTK